MIRDLYNENFEYGPGISLVEAVFVGYNIDWLAFGKKTYDLNVIRLQAIALNLMNGGKKKTYEEKARIASWW